MPRRGNRTDPRKERQRDDIVHAVERIIIDLSRSDIQERPLAGPVASGGSAGGGTPANSGDDGHKILSAKHTDAEIDTLVEGDVLYVDSSNKLTRLPFDPVGLKALMNTGSGGTVPEWATPAGSSVAYKFYATNVSVSGVTAGEFTDGVRTTWHLANVPIADELNVFVNGVALCEGIDFTIAGNVLTVGRALGAVEIIFGGYRA